MEKTGRLYMLKQSILYSQSNFLNYKWYRKLYGGDWRYLKMGKYTPDIKLFTIWTKRSDMDDVYILEKETYPITNVDTKSKLIKEFFKQIILRWE